MQKYLVIAMLTALAMYVTGDLSTVQLGLESPVSNQAFNVTSDVFIWNITDTTIQNVNCSMHGNWSNWLTSLESAIVNATENQTHNFTLNNYAGLVNGSRYTWAIKCENTSDFGDAKWSANETFTANRANTIPNASTAQINAGIDISLTANQTTSIQGTVTVTDMNGCSEIKNVTATLFRTNITGGTDAADNNRSHYSTVCSSNLDCAGGADTTESFVCTFNLLWYADATDLGSAYTNTNWTFNATPTDSFGGLSDISQCEINTLTALSVETSALSFGTLDLGSDTGAVNQNITLANHGNEALDVNLKGYAVFDGDGFCMTCTHGNIDVDHIEYDTVPFVYGVGSALAAVDQEVDIDLDRGTDGDIRPTKSVYYGLALPVAGIGGNCSGTLSIVAVSDPFID